MSDEVKPREFDRNTSMASMPRKYEHIDRVDLWVMAQEKQFSEIIRLRRELELAIAHDRQPYPTAHAYEKACRTIDTLRAENERLLKVITKELSENDEIGREYTYVNALREENARLRSVLEFYGDKCNWSDYGTLALEDSGRIAREALKTDGEVG